jgi:radical SAM superfamily enzyme YgiQ (UPF0313 family)
MSPTPDLLLVSCYELGHQPLGLAMPLGFLARAGYEAEGLDLAVDRFDPGRLAGKRFVGISVPMHTALRLGIHVARHVREISPEAHICFYGLYASLNRDYLLSHGADSVLGGEYEQALVDQVAKVERQRRTQGETSASPASGPPARSHTGPVLARLQFPQPRREQLPPLARYARLQMDGREITVGYTEASRGCLHHCLHCPVPPVYGGRLFVVPESIVLDDVRQMVARGARHITFGDPDFLNGPGHVMKVAQAMRHEHPQLTFDITTKIEHILRHRALLPELANLGCVFIVSAVESLSDRVLSSLDKGHSRTDVEEALNLLVAAGLPMRPSLLPFTPWSMLDDYLELLEFVERREMIDQVDPIQYSIRLLVPPGSALLSKPETQCWVGPLDEAALTYRWAHPDPRMDALHGEVGAIVQGAADRSEDPFATFEKIRTAAHARAGFSPPHDRGPTASPRPARRQPPSHPPMARRAPRLTESWFC